MVEPNYRIKKAFLAAPGQVQLQVLKDELRQRQIEPVTSYESPAMGTSILEHIERAIREIKGDILLFFFLSIGNRGSVGIANRLFLCVPLRMHSGQVKRVLRVQIIMPSIL